MEGLVIIAIVSIALSVFFFQNRQYKKTAYYQITKNPYSSIKHDRGRYGEYLTYKHLRHFEKDGGKFLFNLYLPKANNQTSEIDLLLICSKGLFVFESKNYSGWIFGNEIHKNWTQTLPRGGGYSHKERFYNPIMQNASHIKHLKRLIGENIPVRSIIAFSDRCTFKDVTVRSVNVHVINRSQVSSVVTQICAQIQADLLTEIEINDIYKKLYSYTQVNFIQREQHINNIQKH